MGRGEVRAVRCSCKIPAREDPGSAVAWGPPGEKASGFWLGQWVAGGLGWRGAAKKETEGGGGGIWMVNMWGSGTTSGPHSLCHAIGVPERGLIEAAGCLLLAEEGGSGPGNLGRKKATPCPQREDEENRVLSPRE